MAYPFVPRGLLHTLEGVWCHLFTYLLLGTRFFNTFFVGEREPVVCCTSATVVRESCCPATCQAERQNLYALHPRVVRTIYVFLRLGRFLFEPRMSRSTCWRTNEPTQKLNVIRGSYDLELKPASLTWRGGTVRCGPPRDRRLSAQPSCEAKPAS